MKRRLLVKKIEAKGCVLSRHGVRHDWYINPETNISQPIPRYSDINENLAKHILKMLES